MTRACDLTGKKVQFGNNVSKANNKTKRKFIPNIQSITFKSNILNQNLRLSVAASSVRTVTKYGGIDEFLIKTKSKNLSSKAKKYQKVIRKITDKAS
jgi:large subunit ribosomal protein L28|tara:strand:- start:571 stop:861 length:291 start_codon:yes stop_codon:yes gene_type:complete